MDLAEHYDAQDRELERLRAAWESVVIDLAATLAKMLIVEYEYVLEPPTRPRRETLLMGTVG